MKTFLFLAITLASISALSACARPPEAQFTVSTVRGQAPLEVQFTNQSENAETFQWDFGDGATSTEQEPSHTYTKAASHTVTLKATKEGEPPETNVVTQTVTVAPGPLSTVVLDTTQVTLTPTEAQAFTATALDRFENPISGLAFTFQSEEEAGEVDREGRFTAGTYAGTYEDAVTVEVTQGTVTRRATARVTIEPGPLDHVKLEPATPVVEVTRQQQFTATALDEFDNPIPGLTFAFRAEEVSGQMDSRGSFTAGTQAGAYADAVTVEAAQGTVTRRATARVTIEPGPLDHVTIDPPAATLEVTQKQQFTVSAFDQFNNPISGLAFTFWSEEQAGQVDGGGSFTGGTKAGTYSAAVTVEFTQEAITKGATATVTIESGPLSTVVMEPSEITLDIGATQSFTFRALDEFGNEITDTIASWSVVPAVGSIDVDGVLTTGTKAEAFSGAIAVDVVKRTARASATADVSIRPDPLASVQVKPSSIVLGKGPTQQFSAVGLDQYGNAIPELEFQWQATGGEIDQAGLFMVGIRSGEYEVTASATFKAASHTGSALVSIPIGFIPIDQQTDISRRGAEMVYDTARGVIVLFGGDNSGFLSDTWEYDGASWRQVVTSQAPSPRLWHGMAYDSIRQRTVLFGGEDDAGVFGDTWEYDGTDWKRITTVSSPTPQSPVSMVFDSCRNRTVMFGGSNFAQMWEYDGTDWTWVTLTTSPPAIGLGDMAFDSARCKVVLFGGNADFEDTWEYDGATWTRVLTTTSPGVRWGHEMVYDASRQRIVLFGGYNPANNSNLNDTWEYDGSDWVQVNLERGPGPTEQFAMAYDSSRGRVLMLIFGSTWQYIAPVE